MNQTPDEIVKEIRTANDSTRLRRMYKSEEARAREIEALISNLEREIATLSETSANLQALKEAEPDKVTRNDLAKEINSLQKRIDRASKRLERELDRYTKPLKENAASSYESAGPRQKVGLELVPQYQPVSSTTKKPLDLTGLPVNVQKQVKAMTGQFNERLEQLAIEEKALSAFKNSLKEQKSMLRNARAKLKGTSNKEDRVIIKQDIEDIKAIISGTESQIMFTEENIANITHGDEYGKYTDPWSEKGDRFYNRKSLRRLETDLGAIGNRYGFSMAEVGTNKAAPVLSPSPLKRPLISLETIKKEEAAKRKQLHDLITYRNIGKLNVFPGEAGLTVPQEEFNRQVLSSVGLYDPRKPAPKYSELERAERTDAGNVVAGAKPEGRDIIRQKIGELRKELAALANEKALMTRGIENANLSPMYEPIDVFNQSGKVVDATLPPELLRAETRGTDVDTLARRRKTRADPYDKVLALADKEAAAAAKLLEARTAAIPAIQEETTAVENKVEETKKRTRKKTTTEPKAPEDDPAVQQQYMMGDKPTGTGRKKKVAADKELQKAEEENAQATQEKVAEVKQDTQAKKKQTSTKTKEPPAPKQQKYDDNDIEKLAEKSAQDLREAYQKRISEQKEQVAISEQSATISTESTAADKRKLAAQKAALTRKKNQAAKLEQAAKAEQIPPDPNQIIEGLNTSLIPKDKIHSTSVALQRSQEYVDQGLISQQSVDFFRQTPYGETDKYKWETRKVDELENLHLFRKEDPQQLQQVAVDQNKADADRLAAEKRSLAAKKGAATKAAKKAKALEDANKFTPDTNTPYSTGWKDSGWGFEQYSRKIKQAEETKALLEREPTPYPEHIVDTSVPPQTGRGRKMLANAQDVTGGGGTGVFIEAQANEKANENLAVATDKNTKAKQSKAKKLDAETSSINKEVQQAAPPATPPPTQPPAPTSPPPEDDDAKRKRLEAELAKKRAALEESIRKTAFKGELADQESIDAAVAGLGGKGEIPVQHRRYKRLQLGTSTENLEKLKQKAAEYKQTLDELNKLNKVVAQAEDNLDDALTTGGTQEDVTTKKAPKKEPRKTRPKIVELTDKEFGFPDASKQAQQESDRLRKAFVAQKGEIKSLIPVLETLDDGYEKLIMKMKSAQSQMTSTSFISPQGDVLTKTQYNALKKREQQAAARAAQPQIDPSKIEKLSDRFIGKTDYPTQRERELAATSLGDDRREIFRPARLTQQFTQDLYAKPDTSQKLDAKQINAFQAELDKLDKKLRGTQQVTEATFQPLKRLDGEWIQLTRDVKLLDGSMQQHVLYMNKVGDVYDQTGYAAQRLKQDQEDLRRLQLQSVKNDPAAQRTLKLAEEKGFLPEDLNQVVRQEPSGVTKLTFKRIDEQGIPQQMITGYNKFGDVVQFTNRRLLGFTESIVRNTAEVLRWSIGVGLVYGTMYRLNAMVQLAIQNQTKLIEVAISLGDAQRDVNSIFNDAAIVAKETGESITDILDTYALAYRAVGGIKDPLDRATSANKLLTEATILNKLSSLDAAESIDVLAGSLRQTADAGEDFESALDRGPELLDSWVALSRKANVDLGALATAFSITAETALNAGVDIQELNAVIATLAEKIGGLGGRETGNAVRALIGGMYTDQAAQALNQYGIAVLDASGNSRDFLDISRDIYELWSQGIISDSEINKLGYTLGGGVRRGQQYVAFLTDFGRIQENIAVQANAAGSAEEALGKKVDTVQTAFVQLSNSGQTLAQTLGTDGGLLDTIQGLTVGASKLVDLIEELVDTLGKIAVPAALLALLSLFSKSDSGASKIAAILGGNFLAGLKQKGADIQTVTGGVAGTVGGFATRALNMVPSYRMGNYIGPEGYTPGVTRAQGVGRQIGIFAAQNTMGMAIGAIPAISRAAQGNVAGAVIDLVAAGLGSLAGGPAGALIGVAIADTFVSEVVNKQYTFEEFFARAWAAGEEQTPINKKPTTEEERQKVFEQAFKLTGGGSAGFGKVASNLSMWGENRAIGLENLFSKGPDKGAVSMADVIRKNITAQIENIREGKVIGKGEEDIRQLQEMLNIINEMEKAMPIPIKFEDTEFYKLQEEFYDKNADMFKERGAGLREELVQQELKGQIKPREYANLLPQTYTAGTAAARGLAAINTELSKSYEITSLTAISAERLFDIFAQGSKEDTNLLATMITDVQDLNTLLDSLANAPDDQAVSWRGVNTEVGKLRELLGQILEQIGIITPLVEDSIQESLVNRIQLPSVMNMEDQISKKQDVPVVLQEAKKLQEVQLQVMVDEGFLTEEQKENMIAQAEPFMIYLGAQMGYWLAEGLIDQDFVKQAFDKLMENGKIQSADIGYEFMDVTQAQMASIMGQYNQIRQAILAAGGTSTETGMLTFFKDSTSPVYMKKDWKIVQYLLGKILETEEKQLEGVYNLPGGASFYVPFDAYKMGSGKGDEGGLGELGGAAENLNGAADAITMAADEFRNLLASGWQYGERKITKENYQDIAKGILQTLAQTGGFQYGGISKKPYTPPPIQPDMPEKINTYTIPPKPTNPQDDLALSAKLSGIFYDFFYKLITGISKETPSTTVKEYYPSRVPARAPDWLSMAPQAYGPPAPTVPSELSGSLLTNLIAAILGLTNKLPATLQPTSQMALQELKTQPFQYGDIGADIKQTLSGLSLQANVEIKPQPVRVNFQTTTQLIVDGATLANVIKPYLYSSMLQNEAAGGGAVRPFTFV